MGVSILGPGDEGMTPEPDQREAKAAAQKVSGVSKLVEALSKRAEKEGPGAEKTHFRGYKLAVRCSSFSVQVLKDHWKG